MLILSSRRLASFLICSLFRGASPSLLTAAIEKHQNVPYKECISKGLRRDPHFRQVFERASAKCRPGLRKFYCERVAEVPKIRESSPLERLCSHSNQTVGTSTFFEFTAAGEAKVAFFILAHGYPENLSRLVLRLLNGVHRVLVHVDQKRPSYFKRVRQWISKHNLTETVHAISKFRVNRGGASTLRAWLYGVFWLLNNAGHWDYYINLNDSDYPLASVQVLGRFLWLRNGANFVNVGSAYKDCDCGRFLVFECGDELYSLAPEIRYPRRPSLMHASGPNLVAISRALAEYINSQRNVSGSAVQQILDDLLILQQPDEKFFQTLLVNSAFCLSHIRWSFHIWDRPGITEDSRSPEIAGPELKMLTPPLLSDGFRTTLHEVKEKKLSVFFARKFDNNRTLALQDAIDDSIDGVSGVTGDQGVEGRQDTTRNVSRRFKVGVDWIRNVLRAFLGKDVNLQGALAKWQYRGISEGLFFKAARYRATVQMPRAALPPAKLQSLAIRSCSVRGMVSFEEKAARPPPPRSPNELLPRLLALRIGTGWASDDLDFAGTVSVFPQAHLSEVAVVLYWASVVPGEHREPQPMDITIRWRNPDGRIARDRATVASSSLVSWSRLPTELSSVSSSSAAQVGEWELDVFAGTHRLGNRSFHVCKKLCDDLPSFVAKRYFHVLPAN